MADYTTVVRVRRALAGRDSTEISKETVESAIQRATARLKRALGKAKVDLVDALQSGATDELQRESTPDTVREFCTDLSAHYTLISVHAGNMPKDFRTGFEQVIEELEEIRDGTMEIPEVGNPIRATSNNSGYQPVFDMGDPLRHKLDEDQQDALDASRE